jgi:hypothetical protein
MGARAMGLGGKASKKRSRYGCPWPLAKIPAHPNPFELFFLSAGRMSICISGEKRRLRCQRRKNLTIDRIHYCLERRIEDQPTLKREVAAWESDRNTKETKADWRFTAADARIKLRKLYPTVDG